jgi:hypothetical protein
MRIEISQVGNTNQESAVAGHSSVTHSAPVLQCISIFPGFLKLCNSH